MDDSWCDRLTSSVVRQIRRRRQIAGMSVQGLSDRCAELGYPIPRNVLAKIEGGYRKYLTLPELLVIAGALRISVMDLLIGPDETIEVLPDSHVDRRALHVWIGLGYTDSKTYLLSLLEEALHR